MKTIPFEATSAPQREEVAAILVAALADVRSAWHDMESARSEVSTFVGNQERLAIAAVANGRCSAGSALSVIQGTAGSCTHSSSTQLTNDVAAGRC